MTTPDVLDPPVETSSPWSGVIAVEGAFTGDGRKFDPGALSWTFDHGPLPLTWEEEGGSHDNARQVGWIDNLERQGNQIMGSGTIFNEDFATYLDKAGQIGISIEPDDISMSVMLPDQQGQEQDPSAGGVYPLLEEQEIIHKGRIRAAAAVHVPAFIESVIKLRSASVSPTEASDGANPAAIPGVSTAGTPIQASAGVPAVGMASAGTSGLAGTGTAGVLSTGTSGQTLSSVSLGHVPHVVGLRAPLKVSGIDADGPVAGVASDLADNAGVVGKNPTSCSCATNTGYGDTTDSVDRISGKRPVNASVGPGFGGALHKPVKSLAASGVGIHASSVLHKPGRGNPEGSGSGSAASPEEAAPSAEVAAAAAGSIEISAELFDEALATGNVQDTGETRGDGAALFERLESPTHAGIALVASDTGRMLMLQRCMSEGDPHGGLWEFPGGGIEETESPGQAAAREFAEETGSPLPDDVADLVKWDSPDGVYRLHFLSTATENGYPLFEQSVPNPDDPDGDITEALAWWDPSHIAERPSSLRAEVAAMPWEELLPDAVASGKSWQEEALKQFEAVPPIGEPVPDSQAGNLSNADQMFLETLVTHHHDIEELVTTSLPDLNQDIAAWVGDWLPGLQEGTAQLHEWLGLPARTDNAPTEQDVLTASAAPSAPPDEWFEPFDLEGPTPLTVTADGRVFGHLAPWESCHRGANYSTGGKCVKPPSDPNAPYFQLGQVLTASGALKDVGVITVGGGHFTKDGALTTLEHHDDVTAAAAAVVVKEDEWGIGLFGGVTEGTSPAMVAALRRSPPSAAWRKEKGRYRLVGAHSVNTPGHPVPRNMVASVSPDTIIIFGGTKPKEPDTTVVNLRAVANRIARSAGLDTDTLVASARAAMSDLDCDCDEEVVASLSGDTSLPIAGYDLQWDGGAAAARVFEHFTEGGKVDTASVGKAFLWRIPEEPAEQKSGYSLPFADIIEGTLKIVPSGVQAAAGGHGVAQLDASPEDKAAVKAKIGTLYGRVKEAHPDAPDNPFAPGSSGAE